MCGRKANLTQGKLDKGFLNFRSFSFNLSVLFCLDRLTEWTQSKLSPRLLSLSPTSLIFHHNVDVFFFFFAVPISCVGVGGGGGTKAHKINKPFAIA